MMLSIHNKSTFDTLEECYNQINHSSVKEMCIDDFFLKYKLPGFSSSLIQFYGSWCRKEKEGKILTGLANADERDLFFDNFIDHFEFISLYLMLQNELFYYSDKTTSIAKLKALRKMYYQIQNSLIYIDRNEEDFYAKEIKDIRKKIFNKKYRTVFVSCFDHDSLFKYPSVFYNDSFYVKKEVEIRSWVEDIFNNFDIHIDAAIDKEPLFNDFSIIIRELFHNTDQWGKQTFDKEDILPNLRGVYLNIVTDISMFNDKELDNSPLSSYLRGIEPNEINNRGNVLSLQGNNQQDFRLAICEISVIDSGQGMACSIRGKKPSDFINFLEEKEAVLDCFKLNMTSDETSKRRDRGKGLPRVLGLIGNTGFLRVRTGKVSVFRNFYDDQLNYENEIVNKNFKLYNWNDESEEMARAEGTLISVIYPFIY